MSNSSIHPELLKMIGPYENILWRGHPDKKCFILESIFNPLLPFALIWGFIDLCFFYNMTEGLEKAKANAPLGFLIGFFALHLMPVWIYLAGIIFSFVRYKNTSFAITDQAVYVSGGIFSQNLERKPFAEMSNVNIHRGIIDQKLNVGDIVMTSNQDGYNSRKSQYRGITICDIPDYQEVYQLVKKLQTDIYADIMYPNNLRPTENHGYQTRYTPKNK